MVNQEEARYIWDTLMWHIRNPYGVAGLMGNLFAESSLNTTACTGDVKKAGFATVNEYITAIDNGKYSEEKFAHDGIAFGLAQWLYYTRKAALYRYSKRYGDSISSPDVQLGFLVSELPKYATVWDTLKMAKSVNEASDIVMLRYEKPANTSEAVKNKRAMFGLNYFADFWKGDSMKTKQVITTIERVNVRNGNGKQYGVISQIANKGSRYPWVATADNGWHAIALAKSVGWVSGEFTKVVEE